MERAAIEALIRRWLEEGICRGNVAVFDELLAADVCDRSAPELAHGSESFKRRAEAVHRAFADLEAHVDELLIDDDRAARRWTVTGTQVAPFAGRPATRRRTELRGVNFQRFAAGRVCEHWTLVASLS
jgi:steroid delta-isomerase-like uncharacterized protein